MKNSDRLMLVCLFAVLVGLLIGILTELVDLKATFDHYGRAHKKYAMKVEESAEKLKEAVEAPMRQKQDIDIHAYRTAVALLEGTAQLPATLFKIKKEDLRADETRIRAAKKKIDVWRWVSALPKSTDRLEEVERYEKCVRLALANLPEEEREKLGIDPAGNISTAID